MKNLIVTLATSLSVVFALALANAQDSGSSSFGTQNTLSGSPSSDTADTLRQPAPRMNQQNDPTVPKDGTGALPGHSSEDPSVTDTSNLNIDEDGSTLGDTVRTPRICTDRNGIIFSRGQAGFERCLAEKSTTTGESDQMGGQLGTDPEIRENPQSQAPGEVDFGSSTSGTNP